MTISPQDFDELMTRVEIMTKPMSSDDAIRRQMKDEYYSRLKNHDYMLLKKAADYVIASHNIRTFPLLGEFFAGLDAMRHTMAIPVEEAADCIYCGGVGAKIIKCTDELGKAMGYTVAKSCTCRAGRILERNWRAQDSKYKRKKLKRRTV